MKRRSFLRNMASTGALLGAAELGFLSRLPRVKAEEAVLGSVQFEPDIEPLVRFLEETPRERLLEETGARLRRGLTYRELLSALLLAGVRNIQPRPVGFKFHAVLVVNSAHLASLSSPESDRWLPIFWALDQFKSSQARDVREGNWTMSPVKESDVPPSHSARAAFIEAMDNWDVAAADSAVAGLARTAGAHDVFELFCRYGARDFRDIGHKAIYVANSWRTLQCIGWRHAEPVLRSLAYALLEYDGESPTGRDLAPDRPGKRNLQLVRDVRKDWMEGRRDPGAAQELLAVLREGSDEDSSGKVVQLLNRGVAPQTLWDALFQAAGELVMRAPGIVSLHALTTTNALHFAYQTSGQNETRCLLLLQNAAFLPLFRGQPKPGGSRLDKVESLAINDTADPLGEIFADVSADRMRAARKAIRYLEGPGQAQAFANAARRLVFLKGRDSHDYKFSSAVLEDYAHLSPELRNRYLAASVFQLRGSGDPDSEVARRARAILGS